MELYLLCTEAVNWLPGFLSLSWMYTVPTLYTIILFSIFFYIVQKRFSPGFFSFYFTVFFLSLFCFKIQPVLHFLFVDQFVQIPKSGSDFSRQQCGKSDLRLTLLSRLFHWYRWSLSIFICSDKGLRLRNYRFIENVCSW